MKVMATEKHRLPDGKTVVDVLFGDDTIQTVELICGPGAWYRFVKELQSRGVDVGPEDFGEDTIPFISQLYYAHASKELLDKPELMEKLGYFLCPGCGGVYPKNSFLYTDPCDNCRYALNGEPVE